MRKTIDSSDDKNMTIQRQYYYLPNIAMLSEFLCYPCSKKPHSVLSALYFTAQRLILY